MDRSVECRLAAALANELRQARLELARRWLERIAARVAIQPSHIFPTDDLLNHVHILMEGIADYMEDPADEITADMPVIAKAIELGQLRHAQGFNAHQILKEYEILGGVLFSFLVRTVDSLDEPCAPSELLSCAHRLFRAIEVIQQVTTTQYLQLANERVREREEQLTSFNRMVTHELKNRIGAVVGAAQLLGEEWMWNDPAQIRRFTKIVIDNADAMQTVLQDLLALSRMDEVALQNRNVRLSDAAAEVVRQLRDMAAERRVRVDVRSDLPEVEVNAPALELCLSNYLSNAIKYSDAEAEECWVEVGGEVRNVDGAPELVIWVRDNGIGVPEHLRGRLFERFFRADTGGAREVEGTGLGLSIIRETVEQLGGRAWAEFEGERGATFLLALPLGSSDR